MSEAEEKTKQRIPSNSIRTKIILLTVTAIVVTLAITTLLGVFSVRNFGNTSSEQLLRLLCETGEKDLDIYFDDIEQSVGIVSGFVEKDLETVRTNAELSEHMDRMRDVFERTITTTSGVLDYYYRIDPAFYSGEKGFWYIKSEDGQFKEHEVTDITKYDTSDTSALVWFTVPKATGEAVWLPPYITETLGAHVLSYNVPITWKGNFIGVVGIEMDYSTMAKEVDAIRLYQNGYAFINDAEGKIIYHPYMDSALLDEDTHPEVPEGLLGEDNFVHYTYNGVERVAVWKELDNGMRLNVTVPVSEINGGWHGLIRNIILVSIILLVVFILLTLHFTEEITAPLKKLTEAAEQVDAGNYDCDLTYDRDDEVGVLTRTVKNLVSHLKVYISDLNDLAYADSLTSVHNRGAFDIYIQDLQKKELESGGTAEFAVCVFDCNNLKNINDKSGHDKGDLYLKETCHLICEIFDHSPVFRIGGDEFAAVLQNADYQNREALLREFDEACAKKRLEASESWEKMDIARGIAVYHPEARESVSDVVRRADKLMYENKWNTKSMAAIQ